jgi:hypothetical protein
MMISCRGGGQYRVRRRDTTEDPALHGDHSQCRDVVAQLGSAGAVGQHQALVAPVVGLSHGGVHTDIGGDPGGRRSPHQSVLSASACWLAGRTDQPSGPPWCGSPAFRWPGRGPTSALLRAAQHGSGRCRNPSGRHSRRGRRSRPASRCTSGRPGRPQRCRRRATDKGQRRPAPIWGGAVRRGGRQCDSCRTPKGRRPASGGQPRRPRASVVKQHAHSLFHYVVELQPVVLHRVNQRGDDG